MIKECPTCQRTYSDPTYTFCLADGALLSAPYDPYATQVLSDPVVIDLEPAPTVRALAETLAAPLPIVPVETKVPSPQVPESVEVAKPIDRNERAGAVEVASATPRRKGVAVFLGLGAVFILAALYTQSGLPAFPAIFFIGLALVLRGRSQIADQWN